VIWLNKLVCENNYFNKNFELMLTRHAKAYSSSCLQTVSLSPTILSQFILWVCAAAKNRKKNQFKNSLFW